MEKESAAALKPRTQWRPLRYRRSQMRGRCSLVWRAYGQDLPDSQSLLRARFREQFLKLGSQDVPPPRKSRLQGTLRNAEASRSRRNVLVIEVEDGESVTVLRRKTPDGALHGAVSVLLLHAPYGRRSRFCDVFYCHRVRW